MSLTLQSTHSSSPKPNPHTTLSRTTHPGNVRGARLLHAIGQVEHARDVPVELGGGQGPHGLALHARDERGVRVCIAIGETS